MSSGSANVAQFPSGPPYSEQPRSLSYYRYLYGMKHDALGSVAHNIADSLASGVGFSLVCIQQTSSLKPEQASTVAYTLIS